MRERVRTTACLEDRASQCHNLSEMGLDRSTVLDLLDDTPQSIEVRAILKSRQSCCIVGLDPTNCVVVEPTIALALIVGAPGPELVREGLEQCGPSGTLLATENQFALAREAAHGWTCQSANRLVHSGRQLLRAAALRVGLLAPAQIPDGSAFPESVIEEIATRPCGSEVAACWMGSQLVTLCCATWETEGLWDVFVHTREGYRSMGCGAAAANLLIRHFASRGKRAVWFAHTDNSQSLALARTLGFQFVERAHVFRRWNGSGKFVPGQPASIDVRHNVGL